ncbi:antibiotic biosynthesis monooxygenase family protein [Pseudooceanicola onchidii]|uniref:antibiotic biosynthesis monooxygenase family protein n=1 Tax=Pseudooceanicola onchidii TaxID=2562279 RepID=UPI0010AA4016|nr:antibiotic biosynthesis monooxygenase [Pseudooceanicola onchidii]
MIVVVFRAHRTPVGLGPDYHDALRRMEEIATTMPGYISHKGYVAEDGQRLTLFEWASEDTLRDWARHADHIAIKKVGRDRFYADYHLQVCSVLRESRYNR